MSDQKDSSAELQQLVSEAGQSQSPLRIIGSGSKNFYGRELKGSLLSLADHHGIVDYEPTELVLTARAGTSLRHIEAQLEASGQMLGFEPPHFGPGATLGGTIATGLSGPRRAYQGAARDFVLGMRYINGAGQILQAGGKVMKNVAGYDVARLMVGAFGTLGVILEISLKVLPKPAMESTLMLQLSETEALERVNTLASQPLPLSASCYSDGTMYLRLSGSEHAVQAACRRIGGETLSEAQDFWLSVREQTHAFFSDELPLWRVSLPPAAMPLNIAGNQLWEWGGALRWCLTSQPADELRSRVTAMGGHATAFRNASTTEIFQPLASATLALQQRLKQAFDPGAIFNPGRMYPQLDRVVESTTAHT